MGCFGRDDRRGWAVIGGSALGWLGGGGGLWIVGGEVLSREEIGQFAGELIGGAGLGFFASVIEAEVGMIAVAGSAALATVGKGEAAQGHAVLGAKRGHGWLRKLDLDC